MSRSRNKRYYDDSDDMVERIRRAREAFEKKANAFQGPDWPYYDKRIIQGKKTKEGGGLPKKTLVFEDLAEASRHLVAHP